MGAKSAQTEWVKLCLNIFWLVFFCGQVSVVFASVPHYKDVRIGQSDERSRVVIECLAKCAVQKQDGFAFLLTGVAGELSLNLNDEHGNIKAVHLTHDDTYSWLHVVAGPSVQETAIGSCDAYTICIDFFPYHVGLQRDDTWQFQHEVAQLAGVSISAPACKEYQAELQNDAWNLNAYRNIAFCKAGDGLLQEAEDMLSKLLALKDTDLTAQKGVAFLRETQARLQKQSTRAIRE